MKGYCLSPCTSCPDFLAKCRKEQLRTVDRLWRLEKAKEEEGSRNHLVKVVYVHTSASPN